MTITASLIQLLPLQAGESKNGAWKKQDIIVETDGQYPKKICVSVWGDKIDENQMQIGNKFTISYELESREYNNKWYTDVKAWKIESISISVPPPSHSNFTIQKDLSDEEDDLPF